MKNKLQSMMSLISLIFSIEDQEKDPLLFMLRNLKQSVYM
ncbi:hypothetical protein SAMN05428987_5188 [Paenibacillus sp. CF095]|nr:hypothetical protein SAMN05428987_5188 [Paenibacillus sp. CF095]